MPIHPSNSGRSRRDFLRLAGLAGLGALGAPSLLTACTPTTDAGPTTNSAAGGLGRPLRIGYLPITDASPLLLAHARGLYEAEGLEVERPTLFRGWSQLAEAFQAGQVDLVHFLMPMAIWLRFASDVPLKVVAWDHMGGSALTVAPDVETVEQLAGTTVAIPFWYSVHNAVLQLLFREAGLTALTSGEPSAADRSVKLVVMAPPDMPTALGNGSIAGYIVADPFNAVAEIQGIGKVLRFTGDVWLNHACCVVTASESLVTGSPDVVQGLISAVAGAQLFANEERSEAARLLSADGENYLPQPRAAIERALTHYDRDEYVSSGAITNPDWPTERIDFQPFPFPTYTEELIRLLTKTAVEGDSAFLAALDPADAHRSLVDDRFARSAIETLGGPATFGLPDDLGRTEELAP